LRIVEKRVSSARMRQESAVHVVYRCTPDIPSREQKACGGAEVVSAEHTNDGADRWKFCDVLRRPHQKDEVLIVP
jgi:alkylhydroperoxidase family enzyme